MIPFIFYLFFVTCLIGIFRVSTGGYGPTIHEYGSFNGSIAAFSLFVILFALSYHIVEKKTLKRKAKSATKLNQLDQIRSFKPIYMCFLLIVFFMLAQLFLFGGYYVLFGDVGKGEFRTSFVKFGIIAYGTIKFYVPAVLAYMTYLYIRLNKRPLKIKCILYLSFIISILIGASWGFKSTGIFMLLPSVTILLMGERWLVLKLVIGFILSLFLFSYLALSFDESRIVFSGFSDAFLFVIDRLTIFQGEIPWKIWNIYVTNGDFPSYLETFIGLLGNTIPSVLGINKDPIFTDYGRMVTYVVYSSRTAILEGFNVTSTVFSESIIALGFFGIPLFAIISGSLLGFFSNLFHSAFIKMRSIMVSVLLIIIYTCLFNWVKSGGVGSLIHVSVFFNIAVTFALLYLLDRLSLGRKRFTAKA